MGTPIKRTLAQVDVSLKADGYGMAKDRFVADDVETVRDRIAVAVKRARETSMPTLVEVRTYRFRGHSMSDPAKYRTAEELEDRKKKDPVFRARVELEAGWGKGELEKMEADIEAEVAAAVKFAEESPEPDMSVLEPTTYAGEFAS